MFLKNCWYVAALDHELIDGKLLSRRVLGEHVLLYQGESGKVVAMNDRCPHRGALLSRGRLEGDAVRCMYHGIKYDGAGKCVQIPGQDMIPPKLRVRTYPVEQRSHFVWVWMGDPAKADPALIVDLPYLHEPQWQGHARLPALRRQLPADRRQPERLLAPGVRAHQDARRLGGVRLRQQADRHRAAWSAASVSSAGT